ncbi:glycosyltransferase family 2 protein [Sphingobacterium prati]|uniref:glycosyltransferase family 2 protein n=1 Tax=Sphingobacterium prati TaxID=2737006 RepID=UPI0015568E15|nr:glycosyltransferase family A protein [Sphingobacterium prati]NPE45862.1 glycosyltransferase family 2 protein [Sphingobacterium prati]
MDKDNTVSVIMPAYNAEKFIRYSIESVLNQSFEDWELLIIDDHSSDNSYSIAMDYSSKDHRIKVLKTDAPSGSPAEPRNLGISLAKGTFIAFLDSDDIWLPSKLAEQIVLLMQNESTVIVYADYEKIDEEGNSGDRIIRAPSQVEYKELLKGNVIACSTALVDLRKIKELCFEKQGHEDYALWLKALRLTQGQARNTGTIQMLYRVRQGSISSNKWKAVQWVWRIFRKNEGLSFSSSLYYLTHTLARSFMKFIK